MKSRLLILLLSLAFLFTVLPFLSNAQSTGFINRTATSATGRSILNPNGDNYTSATSAGFMGNDVTNSEIPFRSVPSFSTEPFGDLRRGPSHLYSDFVPDANDVGYYTFLDGSNNMLFRFRMGSIMPGSKGYSVLLDTDGKFGATGANADPNFQPETSGTNGNPGFEIEVVLETNFRIAIYNIDGASSPTLVKQYINWQEMSQVSIAGTFDNGDPDFFIDFYIPFSDLQSSPFNLTTSTPIRMSATTVMSPQAAIGGPKSDIYGLNDGGYKSTNDQYEAYINAQAPFTASTGPSSAMCTAPPTVNSPLSPGTVNISGTWTKSSLSGAAGTANITVYRNGSPLGTVNNVTSGTTWTLPSIAVANNDVITAKAQASGESMCLVSNSVTVKSCTPASRPAMPTLTCANNYSKGITGNNLSTGWVVYIENQTRGTVETSTANPSLFVMSGTSPNITWEFDGGCSGGPSRPSGSYRVYYMNASGCASEPILFCIANGSGSSNNLAGTSATPTITSPVALTPGTTSISGTGEPNSTVRLYVAGEVVQTVTATSGGAFNFTSLSLTNGQQVYITNVLNTGTINTSKCYASSSLYTVNCYTAPPVITTDNNGQLTAGSPITGTSGQPAGTIIRVYTSANTLIATTTVQANGTWSTGNAGTTPSTYNSIAGTTYYATAQNGTCTVSAASGNAVAAAATTGRCGTISSPVTTSDATINGGLTGSVAGTIVNLYLDGQKIGTTTTSTNTWSINAASLSYAVYNSGLLTIGVQETGKQEQLCPASVSVSCSSGPPAPVVNPPSGSVSSGQTQTYTVSNAQAGAFYGIADAATGQSLGTGVWASSSTVTLTTNSTLSTGTYTVSIKGTSLSGVSVCSSSPSSASLLVSSVLPLTLSQFEGQWNRDVIRLTWRTEHEVNVSHFEIERSSDGTNYSKIGEKRAVNNSPSMYSFDDEKPGATNLYRLKMVDRDGKYTYSKIVLMNKGAISSYSILPNPFTQTIMVKIDLSTAQNVTAQLLDINGRVVVSQDFGGQRGQNIIQINDVSKLTPGVYLMRIKSRNQILLQEKIIKSNN